MKNRYTKKKCPIKIIKDNISVNFNKYPYTYMAISDNISKNKCNKWWKNETDKKF